MPIYLTDGRTGLEIIPKVYEDSILVHYGIKGQKHGIRRWQNEDGSLTPEGYIHYGIGQGRQSGSSKQTYNGSDTVFISGKVKYDSPLSGRIKNEIDRIVDSGSKIVIGDAPGADTRVQEYLKQRGYKNVEVFTTDSEARNNVGGWKVNKIDASKYSDEREARAQKDIAMTKVANKGVAISSADDRPDSATSKNIERLEQQGSGVVVYDYKSEDFIKDGSKSSQQRMSMTNETKGEDYSKRILDSVHISIEPINKLKRIDKDEDLYTIRRDINHRQQEGYELSDTGRHYNCPNCACAFDLVERGYDVVARRAVDGSNVGDIAQYFKGGKLIHSGESKWSDNDLRLENYKYGTREWKKWQRAMQQYSDELNKARDEAISNLKQSIEDQGSGARGIIVVGWLSEESTDPTTSFHALNYKVESDGHMKLYDAQSYRKYNGVDTLGMLYGCDPRELHYMRTDNLEIDDSIAKTVYSRGRGDHK